MSVSVLAVSCDEGDPGFCAPGVPSFDYRPLVEFSLLGVDFAITYITILTWVGIVAICAFMFSAVRHTAIVPDKMQFAGESTYNFVRDGVAREVIGTEGIRFAPYLTTLFLFILVNNSFGVIPFAQISPSSKIALPATLAVLSWLLFNYVGIRRQGLKKYFGDIAFPPGVPKPLYLLVTPIELISTLIVRPFTLAIRLFANMFAGHLLLLVFILGTVYLLNVGNFSVIFSPLTFIMSIGLTLFEVLVIALQAYVFVVLTSTYLAGALAEEH